MSATISETIKGGALVLYDGTCGFCHASVCFAQTRQRSAAGRSGAVRYAPLQSDEGRAALVRHGFPADYDQSVVLIEGGRAYTESAAAWRLARRLRWPWRFLALGWAIPRPLRDAAYRWVARNRARLPIGGGTCALPGPKRS